MRTCGPRRRLPSATWVRSGGPCCSRTDRSIARRREQRRTRDRQPRALGRIGKAAQKERQAVPALRQTAAKDTDPVRASSPWGLCAMMEVDIADQVAALRKYLPHDSSLVRMKAARRAGVIGPAAKAAAPDIVTVLELSTDPHERGYIARALGNAGDPASLPALMKAIEKETDEGARPAKCARNQPAGWKGAGEVVGTRPRAAPAGDARPPRRATVSTRRRNPRGSSGYGKKFRYANYDDWGGGDYQDLIERRRSRRQDRRRRRKPPRHHGLELRRLHDLLDHHADLTPSAAASSSRHGVISSAGTSRILAASAIRLGAGR